ncbi:MAG TPA: secondary thiamine-phosphate synthase enzyme YjbQ [Ktedonobacterales bacterium]
MKTIKVPTRRKDQVVDITEAIQELVSQGEEASGVCVVFAAHTTCALTTADLDPGTDVDFLRALRGILPELTYRHPHDPEHAPDHILSSIIGASVSVPFANHQLALGTWQRIVLVELDGPRERTVHVAGV